MKTPDLKKEDFSTPGELEGEISYDQYLRTVGVRISFKKPACRE